MEKTICNLCKGNDYVELFTIPDLLLNHREVEATFVKCNDCGLVYQNPRPAPGEMDQHYPPEYESFLDLSDPGQTSWLLRKAINYGSRKRGRFITRHRHSGRLLDIGCATGFFLNGMRKQGDWELHGVEVNPYAAQIAREKHNLQVRIGTLRESSYSDSYFDAVTMWDVLEHLHDPLANLEEIARILAPDGILIIRVPNLDSWDARIFKHNWAGFDSPRHLYVFSPRTLDQLLDRAGFDIIGRSSHSGNYTTFLLSLRFWINSQDQLPKYSDLLIKFLYHPILRIYSAPFFYLRGLGLKGPQMVVTARRAKY